MRMFFGDAQGAPKNHHHGDGIIAIAPLIAQ